MTLPRSPRSRPPLTLQGRLMLAVIGFVSLILVIVAIITSATLGRSLEAQLDEKLRGYALTVTSWAEEVPPGVATAQAVLDGKSAQVPGLLVAVAAPLVGGTGVVQIPESGDELVWRASTLSASQLTDIVDALADAPLGTVSIRDLGSYRVIAHTTSSRVVVITGLPRTEIQATMAELLTVITLATIGGLILLALTTAITIRVGLRPLRAVAITATRVANQPLDRGEVSITERVPSAEADPWTETGLVGASLNKLLDHVDSSLAARQRNEERMRRFVADASHELRTPLASIRGYSELSLRALRQSPETAQESTTTALERIQAQSLRMTSLVEDLLLLARLDEGKDLVHGNVDLVQLALEGLADARPTAPEHTWSIEVPEEPVVVLGDAGRLHQVIANLLANARTHTPAGTAVTLSVRRDNETAVLRVADDGPGIDPSVRDELFSRFARGDASRARQTGGTGLGLSIVKAIVDGHGGEIGVDSDEQGTSFTIRLPLAPASVLPDAGTAARTDDDAPRP